MITNNIKIYLCVFISALLLAGLLVFAITVREDIAISITSKTITFLLFFGVAFFVFYKIYSYASEKAISYEKIFFLSALFAVPCIMICATNYTGIESKQENKILTRLPIVFMTHEQFPKQMDMFIDERVGFKMALINMLKNISFLDSGSLLDTKSKVISGKNDWLFYNDTSTNETVSDYLRIVTFSEDELQKITQAFEEIDDWCNKNGIKFILLIPPHKHYVYSEFYSAKYNKLNKPARYDQIMDKLNSSGLASIDLRKPLVEAKRWHQIYFKHDTHWNTYGAYTAYNELIDVMKKSYPTTISVTLDNITFRHAGKMRGDLLNMSTNIQIAAPDDIIVPHFNISDGYSVIKEENAPDGSISFIITETAQKGPKIFMIRDSFANDMVPYLARSASRLVAVWEWAKTPLKHKEYILKEKPDFLILEMQERYMPQVIDGSFSKIEKLSDKK